MFNNANSFNQDISKWDINKVDDFVSMFNNTNNLSNLNKGKIHSTFSKNNNWGYNWGEFMISTENINKFLFLNENGEIYNMDISNNNLHKYDNGNVKFKQIIRDQQNHKFKLALDSDGKIWNYNDNSDNFIKNSNYDIQNTKIVQIAVNNNESQYTVALDISGNIWHKSNNLNWLEMSIILIVL